ncbi:MAG: transglycosylase SLT domain-containing protein [Chromatiaceae bacterium]|nr:transglycosylase SLT domain-containing protein [Candidatus Thioaporhodococcus sediminis]
MHRITSFPLLAASVLAVALPVGALAADGNALAMARGPVTAMAGKAATTKVDKVFDEALRSQDPHLLTASGQRYENGVGVAQDVDKAIKLYCRAARMGDVDAQYRLGHIHAHGRGLKRDPELAAAWFAEAVKGRHRLASTQLKLLKVKADPKRKPSCGPTGGAETQIALRPHPASGEIAKLVHSLAPNYRLDPSLVLAVVEVESNFNPQARSPKDAQGLMQLIPATAERFGVADVWDPEQNLKGGMAYLRWLLDRFEGDLKLALAGYNAGEGAVEKHGGVPPFEETQAYVARILRRLGIEATEEKPEQETS